MKAKNDECSRMRSLAFEKEWLDDDERQTLDDHLAQCDECDDLLKWLDMSREAIVSAADVDVTNEVMSRVSQPAPRGDALIWAPTLALLVCLEAVILSMIHPSSNGVPDILTTTGGFLKEQLGGIVDFTPNVLEFLGVESLGFSSLNPLQSLSWSPLFAAFAAIFAVNAAAFAKRKLGGERS